jgi:uncharacterized protein (DUF302 family)
MLQIHTIRRLDQIEIGLRRAAERHGASILPVTQIGQAISGALVKPGSDAVVFTLCMAGLDAPLLSADIRFAAFLPSRVAACSHDGAVMLAAMSPREFCRILQRPDCERLAARLEDELRAILEEASEPASRSAAVPAEHCSTEDQINMRAALPQRIDCRGSKVEDLAGTGILDTKGG